MFCRIHPFWSIHQCWIYLVFHSFAENNGPVGSRDPPFKTSTLSLRNMFTPWAILHAHWTHIAAQCLFYLPAEVMAPQQQLEPFLLAAFCTRLECELLLQPDVGTINASLCVFVQLSFYQAHLSIVSVWHRRQEVQLSAITCCAVWAFSSLIFDNRLRIEASRHSSTAASLPVLSLCNASMLLHHGREHRWEWQLFFGVLFYVLFQGVFFFPWTDTSLNYCGWTSSFVVLINIFTSVCSWKWPETQEGWIAFE